MINTAIQQKEKACGAASTCVKHNKIYEHLPAVVLIITPPSKELITNLAFNKHEQIIKNSISM